MATEQATYSRVLGDYHGGAHDDSSTDVSESLIGHRGQEKSWEELRHSARPRQGWCRRFCSAVLLQGLLNTVLLVSVLILLTNRRGGNGRDGQFESSGDITGFIPTAAQQIRTFVPDMSFAPENGSEFFTDAVRKKWLGIVPKGLGYLQIPDPGRYNNLPHPVKGYSGTVFTTSVTHQLHCLYNIIEVYSSFASGQPIPPQMEGHLPHCFEYLRQSIMCCGDTALEGQHTTFPEGIIGSDGWDAKHVCKDYDGIMSFLEENRADDQVWI